jgi:hypothetical protein
MSDLTYPNGIKIFNEENSLGEEVESRGVLTEVE